ncbi:MAG: hypothetical protein ACYC27_14900 [Armatimonadota bacterium]
MSYIRVFSLILLIASISVTGCSKAKVTTENRLATSADLNVDIYPRAIQDADGFTIKKTLTSKTIICTFTTPDSVDAVYNYYMAGIAKHNCWSERMTKGNTESCTFKLKSGRERIEIHAESTPFEPTKMKITRIM